jgi:hypothetical protein
MLCKGVDLTHPEGILARAVVGQSAGGRLLPDNQASSDPWRTDTLLEGSRPFGENLRQKLLLESLGPEVPDVEQTHLRRLLELEQKAVTSKVFVMEDLDDLWVAVAFPYQAPPVVRNSLHNLFDRGKLGEHRKERRSAVEAPIALAVECVAQSKVKLEAKSPSRVLLLTGADPWLELTAARLTLQPDKALRIEITDHAAVDPRDFPRSLRHFGGAHACNRLFHAGNEPDALRIAEELARPSGRCKVEVADLGRHAAAIGAVRHGGLLEKQQWVGREINQIDIVRTAPVAVGILGTNRDGEWFWRRVSDKGTALLPAEWSSVLSFDTPASARIGLAECPHPDFAARRWLAADQWAEASLRWHEVIIDEERPNHWELQFRWSPIRHHWNAKSRCCPRWRIHSTAQ